MGDVTPEREEDVITVELCADEECGVEALYSAYCQSHGHAKRVVRYVPEAEVERLREATNVCHGVVLMPTGAPGMPVLSSQ